MTNPAEYLHLFEKAMKKLACAFDKQMSEERYLIYFEQLHKYNIFEIQDAINQAIHDQKYNLIPSVGELIKYIEDAREEKRLQFESFQIEYNEQWPEISTEVREKYIKPLKEKLGIK